MSVEAPEQVADEPLDPFADPAASTATPKPAEHKADTAEQRERRCRFHKHCTCSHTECFDGWLDADEVRATEMNKQQVASRRCPRCADAQEMFFELQDMRGGKRRGGR